MGPGPDHDQRCVSGFSPMPFEKQVDMCTKRLEDACFFLPPIPNRTVRKLTPGTWYTIPPAYLNDSIGNSHMQNVIALEKKRRRQKRDRFGAVLCIFRPAKRIVNFLNGASLLIATRSNARCRPAHTHIQRPFPGQFSGALFVLALSFLFFSFYILII